MRHLTLALAVLLGISLTACSQNRKQKETNMETKTLVAFFSATGTTEAVARQLAHVADADLYEIDPVKEYSDADLDWTNKQSRSTLEMKDKKSRPAIQGTVDNIEKYDTVYIGFPIWWYTAPTIVNTFIEKNNLKGKTIYLFATSGGSTPAKALKELRASYPELNFAGAQLLNNATDDELKAYVAKNRKQEAESE